MQDDEAIAEAYNRALAHEKAGRVDAAAAAYREVLALDPLDRGGASVRLAALGRGETPAKAPEAYVEMLFDQHAEDFELILVEALGYDVPALISARLGVLGLGPFGRVLDLGCGTGLVAEALRAQAEFMLGLDLSEAMLDVCEDKDIYDGLVSGDAEGFLADNDEAAFDLIVAADVLPYLGGLEGFLAGVAANLTAGGYFAFSTESQSGTPGYRVGPNQRFQHAPAYVADGLAAAGLSIVSDEPINVRNEDGKPTPGQLIVARRG